MQDTQRIDAYFDWRERGELNEGIFFRDSHKNYDKTKSHWIDGSSTIL